MSRLTAVRPIVVGLVAAAVVIAGCSSKKSGDAAPAGNASTTPSSSVPAATPSPAGSAAAPSVPPVSGDPAAVTLYKQAMASLQKVKSVRIKGSGSDDGGTLAIDLTFVNGKGATGSIGLGDGTLKLLAIGDTTYVQLDKAAFQAFAGAETASIPPAALDAVAGKWLKISSEAAKSPSDPFGDLSELTDLATFTSDFAPNGSLSLQPGKTTINGQSAVGLIQDGGGDPSAGGILYVQADGDHLPLRVGAPPASASASSGADAGQIDFVDYDKAVTLAAPATSIDVGQLMQLLEPSPSS